MAHHKNGWTWAVLGLNRMGTRVRICTTPRKWQATQFIRSLKAPRQFRDVKAWYMPEDTARGYSSAYAGNSSSPRTAHAGNVAAPRLAGLLRVVRQFRLTPVTLLLLTGLFLSALAFACLVTLVVWLFRS